MKEGEGVEVRLFLLQGFWENMLHLSALFQLRLVENWKLFGTRATFFSAKRKINLSRMIFRLAEIDFHLST